MAIDNEYINIALVQTEENRKKAVRIYEMQVDDLKKTNTEFSEINSLLSEIGSKMAITAMRGDEKLLKSYEDRATLFKKKKDAMLTEAGIGTAPKYFCEKCNDSGYSGGKLCECVETRAGRFRYTDRERSNGAGNSKVESRKSKVERRKIYEEKVIDISCADDWHNE